MRQPGPALQPRLLAERAEVAAELRVVLPKGSDLHEGLIAALTGRGIADAAIRLSGGGFGSMQYLTGQPDASGQRVATYGAPTLLEGPVAVIGGNAILGRLENGQPILHCHAVVADREGRIHGGHLPPGVCRTGPGGIVAWATVLRGAGFRVGYDAETNYPIFHPAVAP
jgi:predicted DNA-binding protein with PD1-like motif